MGIRSNSLRAGVLMTTVAAAALLGPKSADAQQLAATEQNVAVQEIVVTAQRQAQSILNVPLSIAAFSGDQLASSGIRDLTALQFTTPGFVPTDRAGSTLIFVRGVGNGLFTGADPSVATYIDDVPRIYGTMVNALVDVERVELLKGAQGGLYGRNATGGVLNVITRQPQFESHDGEFRVSYGARDTFQLAAHANLPLSERVALGVAFDRESHGPYSPNRIRSAAPYTPDMFPTGSSIGDARQTANFFNSGVKPLEGYGDQDLWATSAKLRVAITDDLEVTVAADYNDRSDSDGSQSQQRAPAAYMQGVLSNFFRLFGVNASLPAGFIYIPEDEFGVVRASESETTLRDYGGSATFKWNMPSLELTSISAYRRQFSGNYDELGSVNVPLILSDSRKKMSFFYQEVRAISKTEGPFQIVAGATYLNDKYDQTVITSVLPPFPSGAATISRAKILNWSAYAQGRYEISDNLDITVSGRYIYESNNTRFVSPVASSRKRIAKKFLPSATLSYQFEGGGNAYGRWARGFKGGGVNPVAPPSAFPDEVGSSFGPEIVDTYELGYRAPLLNRRLQVTAAIFYNDYNNLQVTASAKPAYPAITYSVVNAGTARTYGAEASVSWRLNELATVGASAGYLNAKYKDFKIGTNTALQPFDLSGQRMKNAPSFQFSAFTHLEYPIAEGVRLYGDALAAYTSKILFSTSGLPGVLRDGEQPSYWMVNARLGVGFGEDRYRISVYANNLFNQDYATYIASSPALGEVATVGRPRIVGVELTAKF